MSIQLFCGILAVLIASSVAGSCTKPTVTTTTFTTQDATIVSQIAFIAEFTLKCADSEPLSLFAEVDGRLSPAIRTGEDKFQISWTEDSKKASRGERLIRLFDDDGFAAVRKAQRSGADTSSVSPLTTVGVYHPGAFNGPWVNSELLAAGLIGFVAYVAFSSRSKLLS